MLLILLNKIDSKIPPDKIPAVKVSAQIALSRQQQATYKAITPAVGPPSPQPSPEPSPSLSLLSALQWVTVMEVCIHHHPTQTQERVA